MKTENRNAQKTSRGNHVPVPPVPQGSPGTRAPPCTDSYHGPQALSRDADADERSEPVLNRDKHSAIARVGEGPQGASEVDARAPVNPMALVSLVAGGDMKKPMSKFTPGRSARRSGFQVTRVLKVVAWLCAMVWACWRWAHGYGSLQRDLAHGHDFSRLVRILALTIRRLSSWFRPWTPVRRSHLRGVKNERV